MQTFAFAALAGVSFAQMMSSNGYSRGVPPTTQNCNSYPLTSNGNGNFASQDMPWGLVVDREFGGCRCSDEQEMEFIPDADTYTDNTWGCRCLNDDLYLSKPQGKYTCSDNGSATNAVTGSQVVPTHTTDTKTNADNTAGCPVGSVQRLNDLNAKKCGVIAECQHAAVNQQRTRWNQEAARASSTKESARVLCKKSLMPEAEIDHARVLRLKMTKENRMRARVQVASIAMRYRAVKNAMIAGSIDKASFEKAYKLTAQQIARYRAQFSGRQQDIDESWDLVVSRQQSGEAYVAADLQKIEEIYEQTLASLADRYGKRLAYFQSLPIIRNTDKCYGEGVAWTEAQECEAQTTTAQCPILEDGLSG